MHGVCSSKTGRPPSERKIIGLEFFRHGVRTYVAAHVYLVCMANNLRSVRMQVHAYYAARA